MRSEKSQSNSPGAELNRLMGAMGFPEQACNLSGAALDRAIQNDRGIASNLLDAFSQLPISEIFGSLKQGNLGDSGFCPKPKDALRNARERAGRTYYDREQIQTFSLGPGGMFSGVRIDGKFISTGEKPMTPSQFEKKLNKDPEFRQRIEEQVGGRILVDGNIDGKITIAKEIPYERFSSSRGISGLINRWKGDHLATVRDHRSTSRDHRSTLSQNPHMNTVLNQLNQSLKASQPESQSAEDIGSKSSQQASGGSDLSSILNDPTLSFEEKLALFLFAFMEKKQDEIAKKTEALEQQRKNRELAEKQKSEKQKSEQPNSEGSKNGGGFLKSIGTIGGAVVGGIAGGPAGVATGASIGGVVGGALENKGEAGRSRGAQGTDGRQGADGTGNDEDGEQIALKKLEQEVTDMNKMFTMVDNILKSMNDVVKQGPINNMRG